MKFCHCHMIFKLHCRISEGKLVFRFSKSFVIIIKSPKQSLGDLLFLLHFLLLLLLFFSSWKFWKRRIAPLMVTYHFFKFYVSIIIPLEVININVRNFNFPIRFYSKKKNAFLEKKLSTNFNWRKNLSYLPTKLKSKNKVRILCHFFFLPIPITIYPPLFPIIICVFSVTSRKEIQAWLVGHDPT
jgi:hypothetical protein